MEEFTVPAGVFVEIFQISSVFCQSAGGYVSHICPTRMHYFFLLWLSNLACFPFFSSFQLLVIGIGKQ